ncbi:MFS transporter [Stipitochalara longipes BDJ]|nr:MFS transporter [Stipitochalara longipes BDJ]
MSTTTPQPKAADEKSLHEDEVAKTPVDPMLAIYLEYASQTPQWKAHHTSRLLRKVDVRLLPLLILMYLLNFLDRSNLAQARLGTLEKDLGMKGTDFNLATSILFVGYIIMQLPSNLLLTRVKPSVYLGLAMAAWGAISAAQAATKTFGGLLACRTLLGVVEAPFFPGAIMLMSSWYTRAELAHRIAWFYAGSSVANMFGGLLAAGVLGNLEGAHGIAGWRWLFIIEGTITVGIALIAAVFLPNFPATSKWLSEEERNFAEWRLVDDAKETDTASSVSIKDGLMLALKDYRLYIFILFQHISLLTQTFQYFFPTIVKTLGYSKIATLLLTAPVWFLTFLVSLGVTYTSGKTGDRSIHIICLLMVSCIGNIIVVSTLNTGARFFAMFLMPLGAVSAYQIIITWVANSFPRPLVKRSAAIAICNMIGNASNIYGPYLYPASEGPRYLAGGAAVAGLCLAVAVLAFILRTVHIKENKKLEALENDGNVREGDARGVGFRYVY